MAVCILNRKRDSLYPLTLQPADHFRTQNMNMPGSALSRVLSSHRGQTTHNEKPCHVLYIFVLKINEDTAVKPLPPSSDHKGVLHYENTVLCVATEEAQ